MAYFYKALKNTILYYPYNQTSLNNVLLFNHT